MGILPDNMTNRGLISLLRILLLMAENMIRFLVETTVPRRNDKERQGIKGLYHHGENHSKIS